MFSDKPGQKLAVLESKLGIYEDLSREMLAKLESAVEKISESNNRIANILTKHDERIEQTIKTDEILIKMIEGVKYENEKDHSQISHRFEEIEKKIEDLSKFKWQALTIATISVFVVGVLATVVPTFVDNMMSSSYNRESHTITK